MRALRVDGFWVYGILHEWESDTGGTNDYIDNVQKSQLPRYSKSRVLSKKVGRGCRNGPLQRLGERAGHLIFTS
jgi:hypothetical protein